MRKLSTIFALYSLLLFGNGRCWGRIVINEVQSSNGGTLLDASGETPDWIELYNDGEAPVELAGWGLSDKAKKPFKWVFPAGTSMAAGGYLVVFADGEDKVVAVEGGDGAVELHTGFSLSAKGEELVLTRPGADAPEDEIEFGRMPTGASAGRASGAASGAARENACGTVDRAASGAARAAFAELRRAGESACGTVVRAVSALASGSTPSAQAGGEDERRVVYFATPTPGAANAAETFEAPCDDVVFSVERGLFDEGFGLALSYPADPIGVEIRYTLDHSRPSATNGVVYAGELIWIDRTTTVRAVAVRAGALPLPTCTTHTYIFPAQVAGQQPPAIAPTMWKDIDRDNVMQSTRASYAPSTSVLQNDGDRAAFAASLRTLPILAVTLSDGDLFDPENGIYCKPMTLKGVERQAGVEWMRAGGGGGRGAPALPKGESGATAIPEEGIGVEAGFEVHGASSRFFNTTPKKSFRLSFRGRYGTSSLEHKVLSDGGCKRKGFKKLVLRGENNGSWHWGYGNVNGTSFKDQLFRDLQQELSGFSLGGTFVHLFLNGLYWGIYNVTEYADTDFAALAFGGKKKDWTRAKYNAVEEGNGIGYWTMITQAQWHPKSMAKSADYEAMSRRLDIASFIDYMILEYWAGNTDWPGNNAFCLGAFDKGFPYRFMIWDLEYAFEDLNINRMTGNDIYYGPQVLQSALVYSTPYCRRFAQRAEELFGEGGALSSAAVSNQVDRLARRLRSAIFAEAARWGAYCHDCRSSSCPIYGTNHWERAVARLQTTVPNTRTPIFMVQLADFRLHPDTMPAEDELLVTPTPPPPPPPPFSVGWDAPEGYYPKDGIPRVAGFYCLEEQLTVKLVNLVAGGRYVLKIAESLPELATATGIEVQADGESAEVSVTLPKTAKALFLQVVGGD